MRRYRIHTSQRQFSATDLIISGLRCAELWHLSGMSILNDLFALCASVLDNVTKGGQQSPLAVCAFFAIAFLFNLPMESLGLLWIAVLVRTKGIKRTR